MTQTKHVAAVILYRDNKILACKRADATAGGTTRNWDPNGGWEFPGGKVESGETSSDAARRELREELGLELGVMYLYDTVNYTYPDFQLTMDCYVARLADDAEPQLTVHSEFAWLGRQELDRVGWLPADLSLVASIGQYWDSAFGDEMLLSTALGWRRSAGGAQLAALSWQCDGIYRHYVSNVHFLIYSTFVRILSAYIGYDVVKQTRGCAMTEPENTTQATQETQTFQSPAAVLDPKDNVSDATPFIIFVVGCIAAFLMSAALMNLASGAVAWLSSNFNSLLYSYEEDYDYYKYYDSYTPETLDFESVDL